MPSIVVDVSTKLLLVAAVIATLTVLVGSAILLTANEAGPEIREGSFVHSGGSGLFAVSDTLSCSADSDCPDTTCDGENYLVDTDGSVSCIDHDGDGDTECSGYDKTYAGAEYCGGRYDYSCDSTGCDGYKAACKDDCNANSGCDTYDFCGSDDSTDSSTSSTSSCTDQCESLTKKCSGGDVVQCQDTDSDSCTDGFVTVATCDGECSNAACVTATDTNADGTTEETTPETDTSTETTDSNLDTQIAEVWTNVWTTLFGWI